MFVPSASKRRDNFPINERHSDGTIALVRFRPIFCSEYHRNCPVFTVSEKHNWQMSQDLGEFVSQNWLLILSAGSSLLLSPNVPWRAPPALADTGPFASRHRAKSISFSTAT